MKVRCVSFAFVGSVLFAALVANPGTTLASASSAASLSVAGYQALSHGDPAKAVPLFTQSIESRELGPDALANVLLNRAMAYQKLADNNKAIDDYTAALNLDAMTSELRARVLYNRGLAQQKAQNAALAIEDFTSALLINSAFSHAYLARANALRENGQYLFSISDYERAVKYNHPQMAQVYFGEALAYEALKRPTEAKGFLQLALKADSNFVPAQEKLKEFGDVAQLADETNDPILTASVSPGTNTDVVRQALPQAVAPPSALMAQDMSADAGISLAVAAAPPEPTAVRPIQGTAKKLGLVEPNEIHMVVASVPKLPISGNPKLALAKPVVQDEPVPASDGEDVTDSISPAPAAEGAGWTVQVSSANSEGAAWQTWKKMQAAHKVLNGQAVHVVKAELGAKGTVYRVRLGGFADQTAARSACGKLKSGGVACFVAKSGTS